ncbi:uncharacterized protein NESG_01234 [Nematocida ausubeli]|uniref:Uncharacterized protein n=1 Tax=Nematocida ausubeli (strain ATCC PRA-371 / ERTm2) TaxID=1913371 RepID=A0A086J1V1_NEMA1|nr:uncharacterized protein NESG_01234 [Nematocida ausubeli]KAI5136320.1 hypothetical protein NEAUS07_1576 [Nematocida ausubeli]KFG26119.1 hypothetical protein NESG_01234 [Nematocida ausubeli]
MFPEDIQERDRQKSVLKGKLPNKEIIEKVHSDLMDTRGSSSQLMKDFQELRFIQDFVRPFKNEEKIHKEIQESSGANYPGKLNTRNPSLLKYSKIESEQEMDITRFPDIPHTAIINESGTNGLISTRFNDEVCMGLAREDATRRMNCVLFQDIHDKNPFEIQNNGNSIDMKIEELNFEILKLIEKKVRNDLTNSHEATVTMYKDEIDHLNMKILSLQASFKIELEEVSKESEINHRMNKKLKEIQEKSEGYQKELNQRVKLFQEQECRWIQRSIKMESDLKEKDAKISRNFTEIQEKDAKIIHLTRELSNLKIKIKNPSLTDLSQIDELKGTIKLLKEEIDEITRKFQIDEKDEKDKIFPEKVKEYKMKTEINPELDTKMHPDPEDKRKSNGIPGRKGLPASKHIFHFYRIKGLPETVKTIPLPNIRKTWCSIAGIKTGHMGFIMHLPQNTMQLAIPTKFQPNLRLIAESYRKSLNNPVEIEGPVDPLEFPTAEKKNLLFRLKEYALQLVNNISMKHIELYKFSEKVLSCKSPEEFYERLRIGTL